MKPILFSLFLVFSVFAHAQTNLDSFYFEDDSLNFEELEDAEKYISDYSEIYICPRPPTLPGGLDSLVTFIQSKFDDAIISDADSGVVWVSFFIDTSGYFQNAWVARGISPELDLACIGIIECLPKWVPAQDSNGNKVNSWGIFVPFKFTGIPNE